MPKRVKQIRPQLEPFSTAALELLHLLEPVVGRIIGTAVIKHACTKVGLDPAALQHVEIERLEEPIALSLTFYDRSTEVVESLRALSTQPGRGKP